MNKLNIKLTDVCPKLGRVRSARRGDAVPSERCVGVVTVLANRSSCKDRGCVGGVVLQRLGEELEGLFILAESQVKEAYK